MGRMDELVNAEDLAPRRARVGVRELAPSPHPGFFFFFISHPADSDSLFTVVCTDQRRV